MTPKRRLQVFISSTYKDLIEERQAAVEAILTAEHIPAGMELFTAEDKSQMEVIKMWIEESDVYVLILGARYGSIEPESGKSYTHLEYDYARELGKEIFSVVIDEKIEGKLPSDFVEHDKDKKELLQKFRGEVCSKIVRFWVDTKDIKIAIYESIRKIEKKSNLKGWVKGNNELVADTFEQITELTKNLNRKEKKLSKLQKENKQFHERQFFNGVSFETIVKLLKYEEIEDEDLIQELHLTLIAKQFGEESPNYLHYFWKNKDKLTVGYDISDIYYDADRYTEVEDEIHTEIKNEIVEKEELKILSKLEVFKLVKFDNPSNNAQYRFTDIGYRFHVRLIEANWKQYKIDVNTK